MSTPPTGFRLTDADRDALERVASAWGVDRTAVIRLLVHWAAKEKPDREFFRTPPAGKEFTQEIADRIVECLPSHGEANPALLDAEGLAELLGIPKTWLLAEARADRIPHVRLGRYVRFDPANVQHWLKNRQRGPSMPRSQDDG